MSKKLTAEEIVDKVYPFDDHYELASDQEYIIECRRLLKEDLDSLIQSRLKDIVWELMGLKVDFHEEQADAAKNLNINMSRTATAKVETIEAVLKIIQQHLEE